MSALRSGTRAPRPPIWMPMLDRLAKPHTAKVVIATERSVSTPLSPLSSWNATISLSTTRVPRIDPTCCASPHGIPISSANGMQAQPSSICSVSGAPGPMPLGIRPMSPLSSDTSAMNEISMAPTLAASFIPSTVPLAAASSRLRLLSTGASSTRPAVSGTPVSGTTSLANTSEIGAVIAIAVSRCSMRTPPSSTYAPRIAPDTDAMPATITVNSSDSVNFAKNGRIVSGASLWPMKMLAATHSDSAPLAPNT